MPPPPSRKWRAPDGSEYTIWWSEHDKYGLGVLLSFVASPSRRYGVMYRGPGPLSAMSENFLRLCYLVAQDSGFVWIDRTTGTAWHVRTTVTLEAPSGRLLTARVPETTVPLWEHTDARLRRLAREAEEIRSAIDRELWR